MKSSYPLLFLGWCALFGGVLAVRAAEDAKLPTISETVDFTYPPASAIGDNGFSSLCTGGGKTFTIWRDDKLRPILAEVPEGGSATTAPLDKTDFGNTRTQYTSQYRDPQHAFSIGLDKKGYIHVTGDMHGYPGTNDRFMPPRFARKTILYWKSNSPYTVSDGFTFFGGDPDKAIPGTKWCYGAFYSDNNGELYYVSHVAAVSGKRVDMEGGIGLYHYDPETQTWTALGEEPPHTNPAAEYHKVIMWDFPGSPTIAKEGHCTLRFDKQNRMHIAVPAATGPGVSGLNALLYACSEDGGKTWKKADGSAIAGLPFRASGPNAADVVVSFNLTGVLMRAYASKDFSGTPISFRLLPGFDISVIPQANSARMNAEFVARDSGPCVIELASGGKASLDVIKYQKGGLDYTTEMKSGDTFTVNVDRGQTIGLDVKWEKTGGSNALGVFWTTSGHQKEKIPRAFLLPGHTRFDLFASVFVDGNGSPAVACAPCNCLESGWRYWNRTTKKWSDDGAFPGVSNVFNKAYTSPDGVITFESNLGILHYKKEQYQYVRDHTILMRGTEFTGPFKTYSVGYSTIYGADEVAFRKDGVYRAIVFDEVKMLWSIVRFDLPRK